MLNYVQKEFFFPIFKGTLNSNIDTTVEFNMYIECNGKSPCYLLCLLCG